MANELKNLFEHTKTKKKFNFLKYLSSIKQKDSRMLLVFLFAVFGFYSFIYFHEITHKQIFTIYNIKSTILMNFINDSFKTVADSGEIKLKCDYNCQALQGLNEFAGNYLGFFYLVMVILIIIKVRQREEILELLLKYGKK